MMMQKLTTWALALSAVLIMGSSYLLDGPSEAEIEQAQAADLADAKAQARRDAPHVRAELDRLEAERIEPTPAEILHRYALLGAAK